MELQDQFLSREEAIVQRDYHQGHADQWLGHLVLGASTGNGGGLLALGAFVAAREISGLSLILAGIAAASLLVGLIAATYCAGTIRHQALMFRHGYNGIVQEQVHAKHFKQEGEVEDLVKNGLANNKHHAFDNAMNDNNPINRAASFFVWAFLLGTVLTAASVATNAIAPSDRPEPEAVEQSAQPSLPATP